MRNYFTGLVARYKDFTRTQEGRALFLSYIFFFGFMAIFGTIMFVAMWPFSLYVLLFFIIAGALLAPLIIWVNKGDKR